MKDELLSLDVWYESLGNTEQERQKRYCQWFRESIPTGEWDSIRKATNKGGAFGNDNFKAMIGKAIGRKIELRQKGRPRKK